MCSFYIYVLSTLACQHLENNVAHVTLALESCHVMEKSVCLKQSCAEWSKEFENMRKLYLFLIFQLILSVLSNETCHPNAAFRLVNICGCSQTWCMSGPIQDPVRLAEWFVAWLRVEVLHWYKQGLVVFSAPKHCGSREFCWLSPPYWKELGTRQLGWGKRCLGWIPWLSDSWSLEFRLRAHFKGSLCSGPGLPALLRAALLTSLEALAQRSL